MTDDTPLTRPILEEFGFGEDPEDSYFMRRRILVEPPYPTYLVVADPAGAGNGHEVMFQTYDNDREVLGEDTVVIVSRRGCLRTVGQMRTLLGFLGQEIKEGVS